MYRNDEKREVADKWQGWADVFQFGTLGLLFVAIFILESLPKETARIAVWYIAGVLFVLATVGFFVARKALKYKMSYFNAEHKRVVGLFDKAIAAAQTKSPNKSKETSK